MNIFDWIFNLAEKYGLQFSFYSLFLAGGYDSIGITPLFKNEFYNGGFLGQKFLNPIFWQYLPTSNEELIGYIYTLDFGNISVAKKNYIKSRF